MDLIPYLLLADRQGNIVDLFVPATSLGYEVAELAGTRAASRQHLPVCRPASNRVLEIRPPAASQTNRAASGGRGPVNCSELVTRNVC